MSRAVVLALLAAVLAGCASPGAPAPEDDAPAPAATFRAPVLLPGARGGPEPTVAFSPDGVMYVGAQDPLGGGPRVWVSRDSGKSWTEKRPTTEGGGELSLAAGPDGAVYVTQLGTRGNVVSGSRDHGESWTTSPLGAVTQYFDRQWAAVDAAGSAYLLAREFGAQTAASVSRSDDRGLTWLARGRAWDAANEPGAANGNLVAAPTGLYLPYVCREGHAVCLALSKDRGATWEQRVVVVRAGVNVDNVYPALAVGGSRLYVTWSDASSGRLAVWLSVSSDDGRSWSAPARASAEDESATLPWVAADASRAWVVYLATPGALRAADAREAAEAAWTPVARRVGAEGAATGEPVALTPFPAHTGVLSRPVGRPAADAPYDRNFGDFFTAALDGRGKLHVAVSADAGTPESTRDWVVSQA